MSLTEYGVELAHRLNDINKKTNFQFYKIKAVSLLGAIQYSFKFKKMHKYFFSLSHKILDTKYNTNPEEQFAN